MFPWEAHVTKSECTNATANSNESGIGKTRAFVRVEPSPGERFEVDWGHFGVLDYFGDKRKLYAFATSSNATANSNESGIGKTRAFVRVEPSPGERFEVDWGHFGSATIW